MIPSDLPAVLHAMRQLLDEDRATYSSESDEHRLLVCAGNALPALLEHATDVIERHQPVEKQGRVLEPGHEVDDWLGCDVCLFDFWPCPEIESLAAALTPYSTLLAEEKKAHGDL